MNTKLLDQGLSHIDFVTVLPADQIDKLPKYLTALYKNGLHFQVERVDQIYVMIHCPDSTLQKQHHHHQVDDWLNNVGSQQLKPKIRAELSPSQRLQLIHQILPPDFDTFPLHDAEFNGKLLSQWSRKWLLSNQDLSVARNHFGEQVAMYFDYLQFYFAALSVPTVLGILAWMFDARFRVWYSVAVLVWAVVYVEIWEYRQKELAGQWGVLGCTRNDPVRQQFKPDRYVEDKVTGGLEGHYPFYKRVLNRSITVPIMVGMTLILVLFIGGVFIIEMVLSEYYAGPYKEYISVVPTLIYTLAVPQLATLYANLSKYCNDYENHETEQTYTWHLVFKVFISKFFVSYGFLLLNGLVYIPFGHSIGQFVGNTFGIPIKVQKKTPERFFNGVFQFIITGQVINAFTELVLPAVLRRVSNKVSKQAQVEKDVSNETLKHIIKQAKLPTYDINEDYNEMVIQFGCVLIFGPVWTLTSLASFVNNWLELRSDALKITLNHRRPLPTRCENIGAWLYNIKFLVWAALFLNVVWIFIFNESFLNHYDNWLWTTMFTSPLGMGLLIAEQILLLVWYVTKAGLGSIKSQSDRDQEVQSYLLKQDYLKNIDLPEGYLSEDHQTMSESKIEELCRKEVDKLK